MFQPLDPILQGNGNGGIDPTNYIQKDAQGGFGTDKAYVSADAVKNQQFSIEGTGDASLQFMDEQGFIMNVVDNNGALVAAAGTAIDPATISHNLDIAQRNAVNLSASMAVRGVFNSSVQRPIFNYNQFILYGQSLGSGAEGWPALSKTQPYDNLMVGDSVRPNNIGGGGFTPVGSKVFKPMIAVTQTEDGSAVMADADVTNIQPGKGNEGESVVVGAVNAARKMFLQYYGLASDPNRLFVGTNTSVSGRIIEDLAKDGRFGDYTRNPAGAQNVKDLAVAANKTYGIAAYIFMQGEYNYLSKEEFYQSKEGVHDKAGYKAALLKLRNDLDADLTVGIANQKSQPLFMTYQTGAVSTRDNYDLGVGMAQWELAMEQPNWVMVGPVYQYPDKGTHLDPNGYRWFGEQVAKVYHRCAILGQSWKPLSPRSLTIVGDEVLIDFHVPYPPLAFDIPYYGTNLADFANKGFRVLDGTTEVPIVQVSIVAETIVKIKLGQAVSGTAKVQYASQTGSSGYGCLRDSDPAVATTNYTYNAGTGQYAGANIASLVGKPYPLQNWAIAFSVTTTDQAGGVKKWALS